MPRGNRERWGGPRPNSGGKREGAGRPALGRIKRSVTLAEDVHLAIRAQQQPEESYGEVIDRIVREWANR